MEWTNEQKDAIDSRNSSVIVSAAAGSGKTAVLTERLIKLIADPNSGVRADRMIIVTFTNDAAAELKKRLNKKLRDLINENSSDTHLVKQQILLQNAKISTINSFCFELVRENITEQGITSGFSIIDETDEAVIKAQAMDELIEYYSENKPDTLSFLYDKFCIKDIRNLKKVVLEMDRFIASVAFADQWLETAVNEYNKNFKDSIYYDAFLQYCIKSLSDACSYVLEAKGDLKYVFFDSESDDYYDDAFNNLSRDYDYINGLCDIFRNGKIPEQNKFKACARITKGGRGSKGVTYSEEEAKKFDNIRQKYKDAISDIKKYCASIEEHFSKARETTVLLVEMLKEYQVRVWEKKSDRNSISFADGERLALELLAETDGNGNITQSDIARKTAEFYDIIMIDEYQDSNNKQDMIFKLISKNYYISENGIPMYGNNVFLVGDVKQSIYRFRLANPKNFISTLKNSTEYNPESDSPNQRIILNKNFRSSHEVIEFVNYIFKNIMSEDCGDVDYNDDEKLCHGSEVYKECDNRRLTHISFIGDNDVTDDNSDGSETEEFSDVQAKKDRNNPNPEAVFTARKIKSMIDSGAGEPSDFCILVRKNESVNKYASELEKIGIPVKGIEDKGYLKSREIAVLIDLLRIISNPLLDVPMTAVMTSPMYMFGISDIAFLKSLDRDKPLFIIMNEMQETDIQDNGLFRRCKELLESLKAFRLDAVTMTISELIGKIYDTTDFISVMQLYSDGEKKRANLRTLIQHAKSYEKNIEGTGGLSAFLRHIDRVIENGDYKQGKISASSGNYVSVMTLHKSKGLEFTYVFIAENTQSEKNNTNAVICSADGGIGYRLYDCDRNNVNYYNTVQRIVIAGKEKNDERSELMRLMYVGFTRAKKQLFINLKCGEKVLKNIRNLTESYILNDGNIKNMIRRSKDFSEWIWICLMKHADFLEIAEKFSLVPDDAFIPEPECSKRIFEYEFCDNISVQDSVTTAEYKLADADDALCEKIKSIIYNDYDDSLTKMSAKYSVTELTKKFNEDDRIDFKLKRPAFMSAGGEFTGAERGTVIHTFFQYCNFDNAIKNPSEEINRVVDMSYISPVQSETINPDKITAFFESSLYNRVKNSINVWREKKFMVAVAELDFGNGIMDKFRNSDGMIKGIIDLMFEEEDGLVIVDYKSDRGISENRLAARYGMQIKLYKSAIELTTGKRVKEAYLYSIEMEKSIPIEL